MLNLGRVALDLWMIRKHKSQGPQGVVRLNHQPPLILEVAQVENILVDRMGRLLSKLANSTEALEHVIERFQVGGAKVCAKPLLKQCERALLANNNLPVGARLVFFQWNFVEEEVLVDVVGEHLVQKE